MEPSAATHGRNQGNFIPGPQRRGFIGALRVDRQRENPRESADLGKAGNEIPVQLADCRALWTLPFDLPRADHLANCGEEQHLDFQSLVLPVGCPPKSA